MKDKITVVLNKKRRQKGKAFVLEELKAMVAFVIVSDFIVVLISLVFKQNLLKSITGVAIGTTLFALNFYAIGATADNALNSRRELEAKRRSRASYSVRYLTLFAVCAVSLKYNVATPFPLFIPLFYPRIYYSIKTLMRGKKL